MENNFFDVIKERRESFQDNLLKSFGYCKEEEVDAILQKSHLESLFYNEAGGRGFTVDKKGKEIKEKLRDILQEETALANQCAAKAEALRIQINIEPAQKAEEDFYQAREFAEVIMPLPNVYSWEQKTGEKSDGQPCNEVVCSSPTPKEENTTAQMMRQYNEAVRGLVKSKVDIALINTMLTNFDDGKTYKLTVREATILGW